MQYIATGNIYLSGRALAVQLSMQFEVWAFQGSMPSVNFNIQYLCSFHLMGDIKSQATQLLVLLVQASIQYDLQGSAIALLE